jgi:hypothetical protein
METESLKLLGIELFNAKGFGELVFRFILNIFVIWIIVRRIYYPLAKRKDFLFTYMALSSVLFLICFLLSNVKLQIGFALGLFAVFGIIRYRTNAIPIKEMTYLFIIIGISIINALSNKKISYAELAFTNAIMIFIIYGLEKLWLLRHESCKLITYEKIDLIKPEKYKDLIEDVQQRTGLKINRIEVGDINFLRDTAKLNVYYYTDENRVVMADEKDNYSDNDDDD